nr:hypothetical protein [Tanacetum cinerariifolium]
NGAGFRWWKSWGVVKEAGSRGKGFSIVGGKHCALHSVSNVKDREGVLLGDFTHLVPGVNKD